MENTEIKLNKHTAPNGYIYHKDDRYITTVYLAPNASIDEYQLVTMEEYQSKLMQENQEHQFD